MRSVLLVLPTGVPQGILGSTLFNIFIKDLFYVMKQSELDNFADDNNISSAEISVEKLLKPLEKDSQTNADKFQAIIVKQNSDMSNPIYFQY